MTLFPQSHLLVHVFPLPTASFFSSFLSSSLLKLILLPYYFPLCHLLIVSSFCYSLIPIFLLISSLIRRLPPFIFLFFLLSSACFSFIPSFFPLSFIFPHMIPVLPHFLSLRLDSSIHLSLILSFLPSPPALISSSSSSLHFLFFLPPSFFTSCDCNLLGFPLSHPLHSSFSRFSLACLHYFFYYFLFPGSTLLFPFILSFLIPFLPPSLSSPPIFFSSLLL